LPPFDASGLQSVVPTVVSAIEAPGVWIRALVLGQLVRGLRLRCQAVVESVQPAFRDFLLPESTHFALLLRWREGWFVLFVFRLEGFGFDEVPSCLQSGYRR